MISRDRLVALPAAIALLVTPLLFNRFVYDFTRWPRLLLLQVCVILGLAGLAILSDSVRRRSLFDTAVIAFAAWSVFSVFWSVNAVEAIVQLTTLVTMVFTYKYVSHLDNQDTVRDLVLIWAISGLLVALIGIGQYFGIDPLIVPTAGHPGSTFGYRNYVATYLAISIPVIAGFALVEKSAFHASLMALSSTSMLILLLYTRTRGAWVGLAIATACALLVAIRTKHLLSTIPSARTKIAVGVAAIVIVLIAAPLQHRMARQGDFGFDERKADLATTATQVFAPSGARGRLTVWRRTLDMVADHPVLGVGLGAWMFHYPAYDRGEWITRNTAPQRPHNDFIWILSETGLIGFALYLWIVGLIAICLWRAETFRELALCTGALAYLGHSFFSFPRERVAATMLFWIVLGLISTLRSPAYRSRSMRWPLAACGIVLIFCTGVTARCIAFDRHFARAVNAWRRDDWHSVVRDTQAALDHGVINFRALQLSGQAHERLGQYDDAIESFSRSLIYHPNEGHLPLAEVRERHSDLRNALEGYRREKANYPESVDAGDGIARTATSLGDSARAGRDWDTARSYYAEAIVHEEDDPNLHNRLGESHLILDEFEAASGAFEMAIAIDPNYARAYRNLGDVLLAEGGSTEAIAAYRLFIEHWSGNSEFIDQIRRKIGQIEDAGYE